MKVEISSDKPITQATFDMLVAVVESGLSRHQDRLTRAEVHLKGVGADGPTKLLECRLEVRPAGRDPVVTSNESASLDDSVSGAAGKMDRLLGSLFGRLDSTRGGVSASGEPT